MDRLHRHDSMMHESPVESIAQGFIPERRRRRTPFNWNCASAGSDSFACFAPRRQRLIVGELQRRPNRLGVIPNTGARRYSQFDVRLRSWRALGATAESEKAEKSQDHDHDQDDHQNAEDAPPLSRQRSRQLLPVTCCAETRRGDAEGFGREGRMNDLSGELEGLDRAVRDRPGRELVAGHGVDEVRAALPEADVLDVGA